MRTDVVVIGAGISGYATALHLAHAGCAVTLVTAGMGGLTLSTGTVDVLGRLGGGAGPSGPGGGGSLEARMVRRPVTRPLDTIDESVLLPEGHPYRVIGADNVASGVSFWARAIGPELLEARDLRCAENLWLPTAVGAMRPSVLVPPSMRASVLRAGGRYLVVGLSRLKDLTAELVAGNLNRTPLPYGGRVQARAMTIDLPVRGSEVDSSALTHARSLDREETRRALVEALAGVVRDNETLLLPAVLGLEDPHVYADISARLGVPVGEIPLPPPSVPGLRVEQRAARAVARAGGRIMMGAAVTDGDIQGGRLRCVSVATAGRMVTLEAQACVMATGGWESGALQLAADGTIRERVLGLPLAGVCADGAENLRRLVHHDYWGKPQGLWRVGVAVDADMRPVGADGLPAYTGVYAVGGLLSGAVRWSEYSGDGIALGSAWAAARAILADVGVACSGLGAHRGGRRG